VITPNFSSFTDEFVKIAKEKREHRLKSYAKDVALSAGAGGGAGAAASIATTKALENYISKHPIKFTKLMLKLRKAKVGKGVYKGVMKQMVAPSHGKAMATGAALAALVSAIRG